MAREDFPSSISRVFTAHVRVWRWLPTEFGNFLCHPGPQSTCILLAALSSNTFASDYPNNANPISFLGIKSSSHDLCPVHCSHLTRCFQLARACVCAQLVCVYALVYRAGAVRVRRRRGSDQRESGRNSHLHSPLFSESFHSFKSGIWFQRSFGNQQLPKQTAPPWHPHLSHCKHP